MPPEIKTVTLIDAEGRPRELPADQAQAVLDVDPKWRLQTDDDVRSRANAAAKEQTYGGVRGAVGATGAAIARGVSGGISDAVITGLGGGDDLRGLKEQNPTISTVAEIGSSIIPIGVPGMAARAGRAVGAVADGASVGRRIIGAAKGAATEGAIMGAGSGVSELALSKDPLTIERAASVLSSHALFGAGVGGAAGTVAKGAEIGLSRARAALDDVAARAAAPQAVEDLAKLDAKGLRAAEKAERESLRTAEKLELDNLKVAEKAEVDALEQLRVTQRKEVSDEIAAFRREIKDQQHFLTTDGVKLPAVDGRASAAEIGRVAAKATRQLDNLLDNPVGLAQRPERALDALQRHETALTKLLDRADDLRTVFRADTSGARMKALDAIPAALERNRALQQKLGEIASKPTSEKLAEIAARREAVASGSLRTSQRLDDIAAARDVVTGGGGGGMIGNMVGGTAFSTVAGLVGGIPLVGGMLAPIAGGAAAKFVNGGLGKAAAAQAARASKAVGAVLDVTKRAAPAAPVLATKVLSSVAYTSEAPRARTLPAAYKARTDEIKQLTQYDDLGNTVMRPEARAKIADRLAPVRTVDPVLADQIETVAARKIEYLASIIPRRPDIGGIPIGPDRWQPSSMEMRAFARSVAAVEDPIGVFERVAAGTVTPEDKDAIKAVYPEMYADFQSQVFSQLPTLRKTLPYQKRLALSIFSDMPVDASMHPMVLGMLQSTFANEDGSAGGTSAPVPQPQFGSVRAEPQTAAQERAG